MSDLEAFAAGCLLAVLVAPWVAVGVHRVSWKCKRDGIPNHEVELTE